MSIYTVELPADFYKRGNNYTLRQYVKGYLTRTITGDNMIFDSFLVFIDDIDNTIVIVEQEVPYKQVTIRPKKRI